MKSFTNLFIFIFTVFFAFSAFAGDKTGLKAGDKAADFSISNFDGTTYTLSNSGGKATVIMFWSTECPNVQPYTERINKLAGEFTSQGVVFWGINSNKTEPVDEIKTHAKEHAYPFAMLKDDGAKVADMFGATKTPEVFVIDNSTMEIIYHGRIDNNRDASKVTTNDLHSALTEWAAGKPVTNKETSFFGCGIKK